MRILIDTNILIPLEDVNGVLDSAYSELFKIAIENKHQIIIHPASLEDLQRDKNDDRRLSLLSKANKYHQLESPPYPYSTEISELGLKESKPNDRVDNAILYAIYKSAAHILITEDRGIHKKAHQLGISDDVHYIQQALHFLKELHKISETKFPHIRHAPLYSIDHNDIFFDSLRNGYGGFDKWYKRCSAEGRKAWTVFSDKDELSAILIHKTEENEKVTNTGRVLDGKILKISTFKVSESARGRKLGELLLKKAFDHAFNNKYSYIYLTIREGYHDHLKDLCADFGFYTIGMCLENQDEVYVKDIPSSAPVKDLTAFEYYRFYNPFYICQEVSKYIIPIQPEYHGMLFPEIEHRPKLFDTDSSVGNTIKKAYLSHSNIKTMRQGDLILFYRSDDKKAVTTLGIVERFEIEHDPDQIAKLVSKRTVYSSDEIAHMCKDKDVKVILFRQIKHFSKHISRSTLIDIGVNGNIQSIRSIDDIHFKTILQEINLCAEDNA